MQRPAALRMQQRRASAAAPAAAASPRLLRARCPRGTALSRPPTSGRRLLSQTLGAAAVEAPPAVTPTAPPAASDVAAPASSPQPAGVEPFNWARAWYPVAALSSLRTDRPNALQLLGTRLVVWADKQGTWRCFHDVCPHRLVPLSEGRIHESGELQCTYHGWRFNEEGSCTNIPQIPDEKAHATACASGRACVKAYPTQVLTDMLWVWADPSPDGWLASLAEPLPSGAAPEMLERGWTMKSPWFQRDIPLSFDILLENMHDPSHVPQSHSGVVGDRNSDQRMSITTQAPLARGGYSLVVDPPDRGQYTITYHAPSLVRFEFPGDVTMLLYAAPTAKGWSRVIMNFVSPPAGGGSRPPTPQLPPLLNWFIDNVVEKVPALQHAINRNAIMDGDSYFMHVGERHLYAHGDHTTWAKQYYMPATADLAVLSWRKWLDSFGRALPTLPLSAAELPPLMPREEVFDRFKQHTQHCPDCSAALRAVEIAAGIAAAVAAVAAGSIVAAVVAGSAPLLSGANAAAGAVAGIAAALVAGLLRLRSLFIYTDYVHAEH